MKRNGLEGAARRREGEEEGGRRDNERSHVPAKRKEGHVGPAEAKLGGFLGGHR